MCMINRFSLTSSKPAGMKLSSSDYLFRETWNEAKAAMQIVEAIRHNLRLTWEWIDVELTSRKYGNWDHPGKVFVSD